MSIPKIIHYCWFGGNPIPERDQKCIDSWKKKCPDYQIIEWNESNYDVTQIPYTQEAYEAKKWAFVSDYARIDVVHQHGGIYLDTDVELIRNLDELLDMKGFGGIEKGTNLFSMGLGFGAVKGHPLLGELCDVYKSIHFLDSEGNPNLKTNPQIISEYINEKYPGAISGKRTEISDNFVILPAEYFCPQSFETGATKITKNTFSIHHYHASWKTEEEIKRMEEYQKATRIFGKKTGEYLLVARRIYKNHGVKELLNRANRRFSASVQARFIQPWVLKNFEKTVSGKALAAYKNRYRGRRCFFIGNGPSLRSEDLTNLHENGEITFAFNRIYNIFDQTPWRPTFYISQDEKMLGGSVGAVNSHELGTKFIPIQLRWWHGIQISGAQEFRLIDQTAEDPQGFGFSDDIARGIYNSSTGMYTAAQIAAYMGFSEIYLIGVDHHFRISRNNAGEIVVDNTVKDYFTEKYNEDKEKLYIPNTEKSTMTYVAMKNHCNSRGIRVLNATQGGKLEVFDRVEFDTLFD